MRGIEKIVEKASNSNVCVIIDEAYGDSMDNSNSAISLVNEFENLMVGCRVIFKRTQVLKDKEFILKSRQSIREVKEVTITENY